MEESNYIKTIISMIVQDLRYSDYGSIINVIKNAEYSLDHVGYDSWNNGTEYFTLRFHLKFNDFIKIQPTQKEYEEILTNSLNKFYSNDYNVITGVQLVVKIEQYIDWPAIAPQYNKSSVLSLVKSEKELLTKAGTGEIQIRDSQENENYKALHNQVLVIFKQLGIDPIHKYNDLWDWYNDYKKRKLNTYQSRRSFLKDIYSPLIDTLEKSDEYCTTTLTCEPTGWDKVDKDVVHLKEVLNSAEQTLDYQSVGMCCREILTTLAQTVFDKDKHPSTDGTDIGPTDYKRMLNAYIDHSMKNSKEREKKFVKSTADLANELTHNRTATAEDAELCYTALLSTVSIIRILSKYNNN